MNSVDFNYYKKLGDHERPAYDFENLILTAGCKRSDLDFDLDKSSLNETQLKQHGYFIHEFIHHLQNFSTSWGSTIFADFILAYFKIAASHDKTPRNINIPPIEAYEEGLLRDGYNGWVSVKERIRKSYDVKYEEKNNATEIKLLDDPGGVYFENGKVKCRVGVLVIREHMANIGTMLFWGYSDKEMHEHHLAFEGFLYEGQLTYSPEYWIVFEFFIEKFGYKNLARGLFNLMNECLSRLNPDEAFHRFIKFWNSHENKRILGIDFNAFVDEWIRLPEEIRSYDYSLSKASDHIAKRLRLVNSILENDLTAACKNILDTIYLNLVEKAGGRMLFNQSSSFGQLKFWGDMITYYGTPIVAFTDNILLLGNREYCEKMMENFVRVNSVSMIMKKLHEDREFQCPFLYDIPICKAEFKGTSNCHSSPFNEIQMDSHGGSCNFRNGVLLLKLENRMTFN